MSAPWREANREINDKIYRIKMRGLVMRLRAEQRELEEREFRSWLMWERYMMDVRLAELRAFKEEDHPRKPAGTSGGGQFVSKSGGQGLTGGGNSATIPVRDCAKINQLTDIDNTAAHKLVKGFEGKDLDEHWDGNHSHKDQYPEFTKEQYAQRARKLLEMPTSKSIRGYVIKSQGIIVRYDTVTKDYVKGHFKTGIITMFKPSDEDAYYEKRRKNEKD